MKFGRTLHEEEVSAPSEFKDYFIKYKTLKKFLKYRLLNAANEVNATPEQLLQSEKDFLKMLYSQLKIVDRRFEREAREVLSTYELQTAKCKCVVTVCAALTCQPGALNRKGPQELATKARWCRKYAELNHLALRKIAKKRDRMLGGRVGEEFMQACFRGEVHAHKFMSASLLAELAAIEALMLNRTSDCQSPTATKVAGERELGDLQAATAAPQLTVMEEDMELNREHMCAICLDLLYLPVSLSCGHVFCARCALAAAVGHLNLIGNAESLLFNVACYSTSRPCPCCRTTQYGSRQEKHSPFWDVKRLNKLEHLIKERYPKEWERRKQEDAASQAALKAERPTAWENIRQLVTEAFPT